MLVMIIRKLISRRLGANSLLPTLKKSVYFLFNTLILALICISFTQAETEFLDDFIGSSVNTAIWTFPTGNPSFYGNTQIRAEYPPVYNGLLHLLLDTYNPTGNPTVPTFYGSEILSRGTATQGTGLFIEYRAAMVTPVPGLVGGLFIYNYNDIMRIQSYLKGWMPAQSCIMGGCYPTT